MPTSAAEVHIFLICQLKKTRKCFFLNQFNQFAEIGCPLIFIEDATGDWSSLDAHVAQHQLGACLVVELRGDVETLCLGEHITGDFLRSTVRQLVGSGRESKFGPLYFFPCNLHLPNVAHEMKMPRGLVLSSLDAHVAQHGVEIERGHVECLRHLRRRQRVLSILVEQGQRRELLWQLVAACLVKAFACGSFDERIRE